MYGLLFFYSSGRNNKIWIGQQKRVEREEDEVSQAFFFSVETRKRYQLTRPEQTEEGTKKKKEIIID